MDKPLDLLVRGGLIYDGSGGKPYEADIAVRDGRIVEIGAIDRATLDEIDASGCIVTPGFVDVHTHYDGQLIWAEQMIPSSHHGVTMVVAGNCGVGFAPCKADDRPMLLNAMEGVEDIPEIVMTEGVTWEWETFPEYLDALEKRRHDIDFAAYLPHSALRVYVMGDRGVARDGATPDDLEQMARLTKEAMDAGAMGVATSRVDAHRRADGENIPSFEASEQELTALARAVGDQGFGLFQLVPELQHADKEDTRRVVEMLGRISGNGGVPVTFTLVQSDIYPDRWRDVLHWVDEANARPGVDLRPQIFPRAVGMLLGHQLSVNPFLLCPSYAPLENLPLAAKLDQLRRPEMRQRLLSEPPANATQPLAVFGRLFERMFALGDPPNYEPSPGSSIADRARQKGIPPEELAYDLLLEDDGTALLSVGFMGFGDGNLDYVADLIDHPKTIIGVGDGGAHLGLLCDASYTTFVLTHWTRDRTGTRIPLAAAVKALTADAADLLGLPDRGRLKTGCKADLNVIDYEKLQLRAPEASFDLPKGGRRVLQRADGYRWTVVNGQKIFRDGEPTGNLPGRLVRRSKQEPIGPAH